MLGETVGQLKGLQTYEVRLLQEMGIKLHIGISRRDVGNLTGRCPHVQHIDSLVALAGKSTVLCEIALIVNHVTSEHARELHIKGQALP